MKRFSTAYSLIALVAVPLLSLAGDERNSASPRSTPSSVTMPMWDSPVALDSTSSSIIAGPIFDSLGNAWVVISDSVSLVAFQSNGTSGTWQAGHIIGPTIGSTATVGLAVDNAGGLYVTYGTSTSPSSTSNPLMLAKYAPATGWQTPIQIFNSSTYFSETFCAIDSSGRLAVVFNPNGISSIASDPTQSSWGTVQIIAWTEDAGILPSLAANKSGSRLALIYLSATTGRHSMRYTFFNSSTGKWNTSLDVPNSTKATFAGYTVYNSFPLAVDESGNVTFAVTVTTTTRGGASEAARPTTTWAVEGFRYEGGAWSQQQLTSPSPSLPSLEAFSGTALSSNGSVLMVTPLYGGNTDINITVFHYTPGQGWSTDIAAHYNESIANHCTVAWFEGTEAVVVYTDHSISALPLESAIYSNGVWGGGPPPPGNPSDVAFPAMATALTGEVLLAMPDNPLVNVTFLRP